MERLFAISPQSEEDELFITCANEILDNIKEALNSANSLKEQHLWLQHKLVVEKVLSKHCEPI